ncbi:unnamed protein product [Caenorhabditis bovis]|uniref:SH3 domain-containing protein n=1 Tax=Caenorhabditis bovis TaxID=2654633 RepID=A0A8S1ETC0_9PELO|nr:unnamed protein product [Caenorhabditis bovis]
MIPVSKLFSVQDHSNSLSSHALRGIEFLEKIGSFAKERAAIEEEYASKLKSLVRRSIKKIDDDDIWKSVTFVKGFHGVLHEMEQIASLHDISEALKNDVASFILSKSVQHRSTRKQAMNDLSTIDENLHKVVGDLFKAKKNYIKNFKEAENAYTKFAKADKNLEISRLELEKTRTHANLKREMCEEAKKQYADALETANNQQKEYFEKFLPMVYGRFKLLEEERVFDMKDILQKCLKIDQTAGLSQAACHNTMQQCINHINPKADAQLILECVESQIEIPECFQLEDYGDPSNAENRPIDETDGNRLNNLILQFQNVKKKISSPDGGSKKRHAKSKFWTKEKKYENPNIDEEEYSHYPPNVRLSCLNTKIQKLERDLDKLMQGREGLNKLQNAYRENSKLGNPSECDEQLIEHAKQIEILSCRIEKLKKLYDNIEAAVVEAGDGDERSLGGRDLTTPDTTRSVSGYSTNASSKTNTMEDINPGLFGSPISDRIARISFGDSGEFSTGNEASNSPSPRRVIRPQSGLSNCSTPRTHKVTSSPLRTKEISSPFLRSSSSPLRLSENASKRTESPPMNENRKEKGTASVLFTFSGTTYGTISIVEGEKLVIIGDDEGDGWMKVKKPNSGEEGFVPTTYLLCKWN